MSYPGDVDGSDLFRELLDLVNTYVVMPNGGAQAVVAWVFYSWVFKAFEVCPNLMISAPERESGKTRLTEMISWMVPRPQPVSDESAAAIIRGIKSYNPTILIDEAQHFLSAGLKIRYVEFCSQRLRNGLPKYPKLKATQMRCVSSRPSRQR